MVQVHLAPPGIPSMITTDGAASVPAACPMMPAQDWYQNDGQ
jgi:hypothetical protein